MKPVNKFVPKYKKPRNLGLDPFDVRYGSNRNLSTTEFKVLCNVDAVEPAAGGQVVITSSDPGDDVVGAGVQKVKLCYYDSLWNYNQEIFETDGTNPVLSVGTDIFRIEEFFAMQVGSNKRSLGNITVKDTTGTYLYAQIDAGYRMFKRALHYVAPMTSCGSYGYVLGSATTAGVIFELFEGVDFTAEGGGIVDLTVYEFEMSRNSIYFSDWMPYLDPTPNPVSIGIRAKGLAPNQSASGSFNLA